MNKKQSMVVLYAGVLCTIAFIMGFPKNFSAPDDYAINLLSQYLVNLMKTLPPILLIGGFLFYIFRDKKEAVKGNPRKVLVVDDDAGVLKLLEKTLAKMGYPAVCASTGESALALLKKERVGFVLLDIRLPGKSGMEILKEMKRAYPRIPVIMLTALGYDDKAVKEAVSLGAAGYVSKTSPLQELKEAIENMLVERKAHEKKK
jgi:CheY-like chemotaxis protein